jgi:DNA repair protein RecO
VRTIKTTGIILTRTNFGEADRILTFITPDNGKVKAIAKAVRKSQSKLAGGIELFSVSHLTIIEGKSDIATITSTRLKRHYAGIVKDIERSNRGYEFMKLINKNTEQAAGGEYFDLLEKSFAALDDHKLDSGLVNLWFEMQLLKLTGHAPNLHSDVKGDKLADSATYDFAHERMHFVPRLAKQGVYSASHIKFLRLGFAAADPIVLQRVQNGQAVVEPIFPLVQSMLKSFVRL